LTRFLVLTHHTQAIFSLWFGVAEERNNLEGGMWLTDQNLARPMDS
jgi:hypothetical protein